MGFLSLCLFDDDDSCFLFTPLLFRTVLLRLLLRKSHTLGRAVTAASLLLDRLIDCTCELFSVLHLHRIANCIFKGKLRQAHA